jgi:hypothetical protein
VALWERIHWQRLLENGVKFGVLPERFPFIAGLLK